MNKFARRSLYSVVMLMGSASVQTAEMPTDPFEAEVLRHFQTMIQTDTADPPGREIDLTNYLVSVLEAEGIEHEVFSLDPNRPNVVARLRGNGSKRPLLLMAHQDTVNVDAAKWVHPPHSAHRENGWIYGRGTVDDKDNLVASLMTMLMLKRANVVLDRDVIFLAESGEEGATSIGIQFMVNEHFSAIDAEYCIAEGASVIRQEGKPIYASVQTVEKLPRGIRLTSNGVAGHGSVPLQSNAIVHLSKAVAAAADWQPPVRLSDTTTSYFSRLAAISPPEAAARYRALLSPGTPDGIAALNYMKEFEPRNAAVLFSTISPNIIDGGYRSNVIPSEATATLDVRMLPDENIEEFMALLREVINDPQVNLSWSSNTGRPGASTPLDTEAYAVIEAVFEEFYDAPVLPVMSTGATDMAYLRASGIQAMASAPASTRKMGRWDLVRTAIRSASSRVSCIASCGRTTKS